MTKPKKSFRKFIIVFFFVLCLSHLFAERFQASKPKKSAPFPGSGLVTAVYDGDTIKVRFNNGQEKRIRLIGIDAPETNDPREEKRFYAFMAKRFAFYYLYGRTIKLSYEESDLEDKYGRLLAYVWTENQGLFNKFILSEGFAYVYLNFPFRYRSEFAAAEREARGQEKGFWQKGRYFSIQASETRNHIGSLISVQFICFRIEAKGKFVFLHSSQEDFSALIPQENLSLFHEIKSFEGKKLCVTGFLEEYKGKPEIVVFFPMQVKVLNPSESKLTGFVPASTRMKEGLFSIPGTVFFFRINNSYLWDEAGCYARYDAWLTSRTQEIGQVNVLNGRGQIQVDVRPLIFPKKSLERRSPSVSLCPNQEVLCLL
jgi:micrococcal nuclease